MKTEKPLNFSVVLRAHLPHENLTNIVREHPRNNKRKTVHRSSDLALLFNQKRLSKLGKDGITTFLNSLQPRSDALSKLRQKCTDDELVSICKSRYIQTPSELLSWSEYLNANYSNLTATLTAEEVEQQVDEQVDNVDGAATQ